MRSNDLDEQVFKECTRAFIKTQCDSILIQSILIVNAIGISIVLLVSVNFVFNLTNINNRAVYEYTTFNNKTDQYLRELRSESDAKNKLIVTNAEVIRLGENYQDNLAKTLIKEYIFSREKQLRDMDLFKQNLFVQNHSTKEILDQYMQLSTEEGQILDGFHRMINVAQLKKINAYTYEAVLDIVDIEDSSIIKTSKMLLIEYILDTNIEQKLLNLQIGQFNPIGFKVTKYEEI